MSLALSNRLKSNFDFLFEMLSFSSSVSRHTMNMDITSPTFADLNLRYAAHRDAISASVSTPTGGFLGLQVSGRVPSQMNARVYGRFPVSMINLLT